MFLYCTYMIHVLVCSRLIVGGCTYSVCVCTVGAGYG